MKLYLLARYSASLPALGLYRRHIFKGREKMDLWCWTHSKQGGVPSTSHSHDSSSQPSRLTAMAVLVSTEDQAKSLHIGDYLCLIQL